ncbi:hypothetical protein BCR33DRAFT_778622 [Rhizoclosmatium globosum]|uniref:DDE-1 domain-containing protein n=1 Tax=Rhizoclosmatium globosum TaxID=329046 RepID=A0A1Y1ZLP4_9FUNG|nr:hypothetical protein BCR33DRAFT_778622 [Rhizoclosmatium globosum]|eukprot:ORY11173.1 hypothetical protein BCR33DRAFT_778622 [Rhizoclosmatium globosum]
MPKKRTIHFKGIRHVVVKNTGSAGIGISVCLTCAGDGTRLIPLVLFKGARNGRLAKTIPDLLRRDGVEVDVAFNKASWVDEDIMLNSFILSLERQNGNVESDKVDFKINSMILFPKRFSVCLFEEEEKKFGHTEKYVLMPCPSSLP